ncbi:hypothetical protein [Bacillus wiedmannii]|uniref:Uncharacterized protein n=1 Tax=Bacillus wiedmannii TaxID=1890302 RepID=A0AB73R3H7_9BACI|nr:hypothetical protein [Bacillus wiedmannii]PEK17833.1 hypothetical protein CN694_27500 [Bacillus wiedmannii]
MGKYKIDIQNSHVVSIGDKNRLENINIGNFESGEIDIKELKAEILKVQTYLLEKESKTIEEKILLSDVSDLQRISENGTLEIVTNDLKNKASRLFFDTATGVNAGIIANIISKFIGL